MSTPTPSSEHILQTSNCLVLWMLMSMRIHWIHDGQRIILILNLDDSPNVYWVCHRVTFKLKVGWLQEETLRICSNSTRNKSRKPSTKHIQTRPRPIKLTVKLDIQNLSYSMGEMAGDSPLELKDNHLLSHQGTIAAMHKIRYSYLKGKIII